MENTEEIWKDVAGFDGYYRVSNLGRVKSFHQKKERIVSQATSKKGYKRVYLSLKCVKAMMVHRVVAIAFLPNPLNKSQVNHINGIKTDNRVDNLEWSTPLENNRHAIENQLIRKKGDGAGNSKLTTEQVLRIRELSAKGMNSTQIKKEIGIEDISKTTIFDIVKRKCWYHI
jgi:hypothetical protein